MQYDELPPTKKSIDIKYTYLYINTFFECDTITALLIKAIYD